MIGKEPKVIEGELTAGDLVDKKTKHPSKTYKVRFAKGKTYRIDLHSPDRNSVILSLRLEDASGKELPCDRTYYPGGAKASADFPDWNFSEVHSAKVSDEYRLVVVSPYGGKLGKYRLTVYEAPAVPMPLEKWGFAVANKTWGLEFKSVAFSYKTMAYTFLVEFTKDLKPDELKTLREEFPPTNSGKGSKSLMLYFFDADNVVGEKRKDFGITGELTGVKGDAFRFETGGASKIECARVALRQTK